jgi:hypothetical protein
VQAEIFIFDFVDGQGKEREREIEGLILLFSSELPYLQDSLTVTTSLHVSQLRVVESKKSKKLLTFKRKTAPVNECGTEGGDRASACSAFAGERRC